MLRKLTLAFALLVGWTAFGQEVIDCNSCIVVAQVPPTPVTLLNPSFELAAPTGNYDINIPITGWPCATGTGRYFGRLNPTASQIAIVPDGKTVLWLQNDTCTQDSGVAASVNTTYTLKFNVGSQANFLIPAVYSANLLIGTAPIPGCSAGGDPLKLPGVLVQQTLTCTTGSTIPVAGNIVVSLGSGNNQTIFDNVSLTSVTSLPPKFVNFLFPVHFFNCTKCDKTDDSTSQMGIFSGAVINLSQDGTPICSGTVNTNGEFSCSGPLNITPSFVNVTLVVSDATGKPIAPPFTNGIANFILAGRSVVNVNFRLDAATTVPRGLDIWTL